MPDEHIAAPGADFDPIIPLLAYQREDIESDARFNWCCWSRQTGKSFTKSLRRLLRGILRRRTQVLLSASERQSRELMLKVQQHCRALQLAARSSGLSCLDGTTFRGQSMELPNGVRVIGLPANPRTARGFTGDVLLDEFAMHRDDREIWAALLPTILRDGGEIDIASTPRGLDNIFASLRDNPSFRHSIVTLDDAVAAGLDVDPEAIRRSLQDDELYRQEFCCAFLDESSAFLTYAQIARVEDPALEVAADLQGLVPGGALFAGVDIGRSRDRTVIWIVGAEGAAETVGCLVTRAVLVLESEGFRAQTDLLRDLLRLPAMRRCCIDATGIGMPLAEEMLEQFGSGRVEGVTFTPRIKDELATGLRLRIEGGTIRIPTDEAIRRDWHSVRRSITASGPVRYDATRSAGGHADRFWAACLAVRAAGAGDRGRIEAVRGEPLRFSRRGTW